MNRKQNSLMRFSRTERLAQLSEQEIVIERKKREIQAKIEAQKKKETEEALRKLESSNELKNKPGFSKKPPWKRDEKDKEKGKHVDQGKEENLTNAFSNDGSFLDQFKKLSKTGLVPSNVDVQTLATARKHNEDAEDKLTSRRKEDRRERETVDEYRDIEKGYGRDQDFKQLSGASQQSSGRKPLDSNIQLQLPPPGVVQLVPQHQVQMASLVQPVQNPITMTVPSEISTSQSAGLNSVPKFTTNEIQLKAISSSPSYNEVPQPVPPVHDHIILTSDALKEKKQSFEETSQTMFSQSFSISQLSSVQPPPPMTPQNIPRPSPIQVQNIPPPPLPPKETDYLESKPMTANSALDEDSNPTFPLRKEPKFNVSEKREKCQESGISGNSSKGCDSIPLPETGSQDDESSRISPALYDFEDEDDSDEVARTPGEGANDKYHNFARMVARCGDDFEDSLRKRNEGEEELGFLFDKNSKEYLSYRKLVQKYRRKLALEKNSEYPKNKSNESNTSKENSSEKSSLRNTSKGFSEQAVGDSESAATRKSLEAYPDRGDRYKETYESKCNDGYQADNEEDFQYYKMPEASSKEEYFIPSHKPTPTHSGKDTENSDSAPKEDKEGQSKVEERRKRKRKSRWGDAVPTTSSVLGTNVGANLIMQTPGSLPAPKSTLLSQLTRSDPGLIQYARQTFGSTNLSEEDWKKAEDHYKINLLYQDLMKKRAEIDKLERSGKFKYEYDSDEDVEGGTWEHKLRQQEMMATQLWAEELTRQAAGKHHIGDFLPPEELERFMEKYNAVKEGREPDLSDYKEFKLKEDNVGYRLLQKMGWNEGQGLGQDGTGITNPVNKAVTRHENQGLGIDRPDGLEPGDDEYDAYRKRMMLAYRFRPNPLNNPRRPYY